LHEEQQHIGADLKGAEAIIVLHHIKSEYSLVEAPSTTDVRHVDTGFDNSTNPGRHCAYQLYELF